MQKVSLSTNQRFAGERALTLPLSGELGTDWAPLRSTFLRGCFSFLLLPSHQKWEKWNKARQPPVMAMGFNYLLLTIKYASSTNLVREKWSFLGCRYLMQPKSQNGRAEVDGCVSRGAFVSLSSIIIVLSTSTLLSLVQLVFISLFLSKYKASRRHVYQY